MFAKARIDRYLLDGLPPEFEVGLRFHIEKCTSCRDHYNQQVILLRALRGDVDTPAEAESERVIGLVLAKTGLAEEGQRTARLRDASWLERLVWTPAPVLAAATALLVLLVVIAAAVGLAGGPSTVVGHLTAAEGISVDGLEIAGLESKGSRLREGQVVTSNRDGGGEIELVRGGTLRLYPNSRLVVEDDGDRVGLDAGKVWCLIEKGRGGFVVVTDAATAAVLGTSFIVDRSDEAGTEVRVIEGRVAVSDVGGRGRVEVAGGQRSRVEKGAAPEEPRRYRPGRDRSEWDRLWARICRAFERAGRKLERLFDGL